ncbi:MAG: hypothetical protein AB7P03_05025 [Kofleriaceae bacterium]
MRRDDDDGSKDLNASRCGSAADAGSVSIAVGAPRRLIQVFLIALLAVADTGLAHAQPSGPSDKETAGRLLDEGIARFEAGDHASALARFEAAYQLVPTPKIFLNIAGALEKLGREPEAAETYERYLAETVNLSDIPAENRQFAERALGELRTRLGRVSMVVQPETAALTVDRQPVKLRSSAALYLTPGSHVVVASAAGYRARTIQIEAAAGTEQAVQIELTQADADADASSHAPAPSDGRGKRLAGMVVFGAGMVGLVAGAYFGLDAHRTSEQVTKLTMSADGVWDPALERDGKRSARKALVSVSIGGAAVVAGSILYYLGWREARSNASRAAGLGAGLGVAVSPTGAWVQWQSGF